MDVLPFHVAEILETLLKWLQGDGGPWRAGTQDADPRNLALLLRRGRARGGEEGDDAEERAAVHH